MRTQRREFSVGLQLQIVRRATDEAGMLHCEKCHAWLKKRADYDFDHVIPEAMLSDADKKRPLTAASGQLICHSCHREKKTPRDVADVARAKRLEAGALGLKSPGKGKFGGEKKAKAPLTKVAAGPTAMQRRYSQ